MSIPRGIPSTASTAGHARMLCLPSLQMVHMSVLRRFKVLLQRVFVDLSLGGRGLDVEVEAELFERKRCILLMDNVCLNTSCLYNQDFARHRLHITSTDTAAWFPVTMRQAHVY